MNSIRTRCQSWGRWLAALVVAMVAIIGGTLVPDTARAAGLLIADGGLGGVLEIRQQEVQVTVNNQVAVTTVTQVFKNTENRQVEALYTFPVPRGASVANFSMWINGKEMVGEVLEKKRAREIYNSYKRKRRDPGLLEQNDYKSFEMRIFPINAGAEQRVQITYYQELGIDHDRATYVYPLSTVSRPQVDSRTTGTFSMTVEIKSAVPIVTVDSPSHTDAFVTATHSDHYRTASLEQVRGRLDRDVVVSWQMQRPRTGLDLITSRRSGQEGFFSMILTAGPELAALDTGMDYVFLLDISGSMGNDRKLVISRDSVAAFMDELGPRDRFEVMTFNVRPETLFGSLQAAGDDTRRQAADYLASRRARGGTVLAPAMRTAYRYGEPDRTLNVVVLSDGMTEQKERETLMALIADRPGNTRVFCIGIGNEVNRRLLEQMAEDTGGLAAFVSRGDNLKRQAQAFRRKLMRPAMAELALEFDGIRVTDLEPAVLPNLYHGAPVRLYGRYAGSGKAEVTLTGTVQGREIRQTATMTFAETDDDNPEIERMWAFKRIDGLLKRADRKGDRTAVMDEVVSLGEDFSIVTQYTSFLVLENDAEYQRWKIDRRNRKRIERDRSAQGRRAEQLEAIRRQAVAGLGPQPAAAPQKAPPAIRTAQADPRPGLPPASSTPPATAPPAPRSQGFDLDLGSGSGPVGPLFVGWAWWMKRRKKRR